MHRCNNMMLPTWMCVVVFNMQEWNIVHGFVMGLFTWQYVCQAASSQQQPLYVAPLGADHQRGVVHERVCQQLPHMVQRATRVH